MHSPFGCVDDRCIGVEKNRLFSFLVLGIAALVSVGGFVARDVAASGGESSGDVPGAITAQAAPPLSATSYGVNLSFASGSSTELAFVDVFTVSREWISSGVGSDVWESGVEFPIDERGWPIEIPYDNGVDPPQEVKTLMNREIASGNFTVCTDAPYQPFEFEDEDGQFTGFDMDLLREISGNVALQLSVKVVPFDGIWLLPAAGECDVVGSAMTITPARAQSTLFSTPYFDADQSLLVQAENADRFPTLASLAGQRIAVQTGTTGEIYAEENAPADSTLVSCDEPAAMFLALASGDVDAILQDLPVNGYRQTQDPSLVVTETFPTGEQYGFAVDPDNEALIEAINDELAKMRSSGSYDDIFEKWFG